MNYIFNIFNYIIQIIPFDLRLPLILDWTKALLKPVQVLNDDLGVFVVDNRKRATFTGQVIYLEHLLNDELDDPLRRIYIDDGQQNVLPPYVFNKVEQRPIYLYNKSEGEDKFYVYNQVEFFTNADFIVFVPNAILAPALQIELERLVDLYKQAGKIYEVQGF